MSLCGNLLYFLFIYSFGGNNIGIAGAQALADYLKHYTNLQHLG